MTSPPSPSFSAADTSVHASVEPGLDALGTVHDRARGAVRIACLVPSITELLCTLDLRGQLVARTGFCVHPRAMLADVPKVGGTKDVKLEALRALAPTHAIVNIDENERSAVEAIRAFVPHVIVTHPCAPQDNFALYRLLGHVFDRDAAAETLCQRLQAGLERLAARDWPARRVLYAIWPEPWMTVGPDTYIARMLALINWQTWPRTPNDWTFGGEQVKALPRYPEFRWTLGLTERLDAVLLASEPYRFDATHADTLAMRLGVPVQCIDGEMLSWYGSRAIEGLDYLEQLGCGRRS